MGVFDLGTKVEHIKYGPVTIKGESPSGIRVEYDNPPEELGGDTEDIVCAEELQTISPYTNDEVITAITRHFSLLFDPTDQVCVTFIPSAKATLAGKNIENFCGPLSKVTTRTGVARLQVRNDDCNAYIAMNPLAAGAKNRRKELAGAPRNVFMEVDENGDAVLAAVRISVAKGEIPRPTVILKSSPGKYQFVWRINTDRFTMEKVERINDALVRKFGADPACTDCLRLFRIPALRNLKYAQRPVVEVVECAGGGPYAFGDFDIPLEGVKAAKVSVAAAGEEISAIVAYLETAAEEAKIALSSMKKWGDNGWIWEVTCPWVQEHTGQKDSGTAIILHKSGALDFNCAHGHCKHRTWRDLRTKMEEVVGHILRFGDQVDNVILNGTPSEPAITVSEYVVPPFSDGTVIVPGADGQPNLQAMKNLDVVVSRIQTATVLPPFDKRLLKGFYEELVGVVTQGNTLPPQYVFGLAKSLVGLRCAGKTRFEGCDKQPRYYYMMIGETGCGKGESWRRTRDVLTMKDSHLGFDQIMKIFNSADSGAGLKESFFDKNGQGLGIPVALYIDEIIDLGSKTRADRNPDIISTMLELANGTSISRVKANTTWTCNNAKLGVIMCAQPTMISVSFANMKGGELGWYDRLTPEIAYPQEVDEGLRPLEASETVKVSMAFDALPYDSMIKEDKKASSTIQEHWRSLPKEARQRARRLDHLNMDMYMLAFGRRSPVVEVDDALWAIYLDKRRQDIRDQYLQEEVPDRVGDYSRRIKVIIKGQHDALKAGDPPEKVQLSERDFMNHTNAYRKNEEVTFKKAWASIVDTLLRPIEEVSKAGRPTRYYLPRYDR
jgi:hypothetical protein